MTFKMWEGELPESCPRLHDGTSDSWAYYSVKMDEDSERHGTWLCKWDGFSEPVLSVTVILLMQLERGEAYQAQLDEENRIAKEARERNERRAAKLAAILGD